ncbi:DNA glycosylase AlkZ-like family protein [Cumulibacter manganitolerans]|uniref:DNA glycosylase AlkZ-like family protein n=1 Tax=Cumulibacter manganitolerans TaxID=1884992 RepID=UPI0012959B9F|nr:crosslink repair DNA glycosylase YcaQ family protein [Cumulibacter manganitolerans]
MGVRTISRQDARRIAVRAQLLDANRPTGLTDVVRHLAATKVDGTAYVAPNVELVLCSRLGPAYDAAALDAAQTDRRLVEFRGWLRVAEDIALYLADMAAWPGPDASDWRLATAEWHDLNRGCAEEILEVLRTDGPLPVRDLPDCCDVDWRSSGWNNRKNTTMLVEQLEARGEVAVSHRERAERHWDLASRIYPDVAAVPATQAAAARNERRLRALGIARAKAAEAPDEPWDVGTTGVQVAVDGVRGTWRADPALLDAGPFRGRTALLSPLDRLVFDRKRMTELFEFDYALEMYKPAARRRWGYFALPVLHGDRLVGKVDVEADHLDGRLHLHAVHYDEAPSRALEDGVRRELLSLAGALGLVLVDG